MRHPYVQHIQVELGHSFSGQTNWTSSTFDAHSLSRRLDSIGAFFQPTSIGPALISLGR